MMRGLVLAGGQSRRFGSDKAEAIYGGQTFLYRAVKMLEEFGLQPLVLARERADYILPGTEIRFDLRPGKGPLGGIYTAMQLYPDTDFLVMTCDMPNVDKETLEKLIDQYKEQPFLTVYFSSRGKIEPFPGIYPYFLYAKVSRLIFTEKLSMREFLESVPEKNIILFDGKKRELANVNYLSDLLELQNAKD